MGYWNSRGLRGSALEELINLTNEKYREKSLAMVQKIPTPIKPIKLNSEKGTISLAYFEQKSTVDYIGVVQGIPICFDAKETLKDSLPLRNIHQHQIDFMKDFEQQEGIAFLIVFFTKFNRYYFLPLEKLLMYWKRAENGGRKSIHVSECEGLIEIETKSGFYLHYLEAIRRYIE